MNKISVIAPANSIIGEKNKNLLNLGRDKLELCGFEVEYEKNIFSDSLYSNTGTIAEKIEDLNAAFLKDSNIILCATGGINSNCILEFIDKKIIKEKAHKKIFIGNSNNTILLNYLSEFFSVKCFLGSNLKGIGKNEAKLSLKNFKEKIIEKKKYLIFSKQPIIVNEGKSEGITFGGNGASLRRIIGTKYFPSFDNKIFVLEFSSKENTPIEVLSILSQLKQIEVFDKISGLILGEYSEELSIKELVFDYVKDKKYPVIITDDIGHSIETTFIPIGTRIRIDTNNNCYIEK